MKRNYWFLMLTSLAVLLTLSACGSAGSSAPPVSIAEACALENDGQKATVVGFFQTDFMVFCTESCTLDFAETPGGESPLKPDIKVGSGRNQMRALPEEFQEADFQFTAQNGTILGLSDPIQLSGKMSIAPNVCLMYVDQINPAP
jgi:hypothetical protein